MAERFTESDWYTQPLYYDIVFDDDTDVQAAFLEGLIALHGHRGGGRVLEPACGSGRLLEALGRRGWRVAGFDASREMLAFSRARLRAAGLGGTLREARLEDFALPGSFDLAHCLISTFKYLLSEAEARAHLTCVARALRPGGLYVLGLHLSDYEETRRSRERWVGERDGVKVVCNIQGWPPDRRRRLEKVRSRLVVERDGRTRRCETSWLFRTYDTRQLRRLLRSVPALEHVATYDFTHDLHAPRELSDEQLDTVLVLRRRACG